MKTHEASYRDPSGFLYERGSVLYRQVNKEYSKHLEYFFSSGLYNKLLKEKLIVASPRVDITKRMTEDAHAVLQPEIVPFISYPYEWCFDELKDAALLTLRIQKIALNHGMILKDASAYNVQFVNSQPIFIDTLSFELYDGYSPWIAYRQFIEHFLGPLLLMRYVDERALLLHRVSSDGVPLDMIAKLLPKKTLLNTGALLHIHFQAKVKEVTSSREKKQDSKLGKKKLLNLITHLEQVIIKLSVPKANTLWGKYYSHTNYNEASFKEKSDVISKFLEIIKPSIVWDVGANNGYFTKLCAKFAKEIYAFDVDYAATNEHYLYCKKNIDSKTLPLVMDLTNPSPSNGFFHTERNSLIMRANADTVLALALIHHLTLRYSIPFKRSAEFLRALGNTLIIEFPHANDSQVQKLLGHKLGVAHEYSQELFEKSFSEYFNISSKHVLLNANRTIYYMIGK